MMQPWGKACMHFSAPFSEFLKLESKWPGQAWVYVVPMWGCTEGRKMNMNFKYNCFSQDLTDQPIRDK